MKKILLIFLFTVVSNFSQVTQEWVRRYDGFNNSDEAVALALDKLGNVYVSGNGVGPSGNNFDYQTIKYNSNGDVQWVQRYESPSEWGGDQVNAMAVDSAGNVYVTGWSHGTGYFNEDFLTVKYNSNGVEQWVQRYDGPNNERRDIANAITLDYLGNVYVTGYSNSIATADDYVTIKYSSDGVLQWIQKFAGLYGTDIANDVAVDALGNVYVTGSSYNADYIPNYLTIKYNSGGALQWIQSFDGLYDEATDIAIDNLGSVYVTGSSYGADNFQDYLTIKYNSDGVVQWFQRYGIVNENDIANDIAVDNSGKVYVTGVSGSNSNAGYATIKYSSNGVEQWDRRYDGPSNGYDGAIALALDSIGNVYVTGSIYTQGSSNNYATIKYDSSGTQEWDQIYNGPANSNEAAKAIVVDVSGIVYVTGSSLGIGTGPDYATIKYFHSPALEFTRPLAGEKWIAGETDTIKWTGGQTGQILGIDYSTDNGITYSDISFGTPADSGYYVWDIPKTILTTKAKIKLSDITDPNIKAVSDSFKIKPYIITKLDASGDYIAYNINTDRWGFSNTDADVWPRSWFQQFNYRGIDPFTNQQYPLQGIFEFYDTPDSIHPDWISWVNTFGVNACYMSASIPIYNLNAILRWQVYNSTWNGSCYGISASNALAFQAKNNFQTRYPNFPNFTNPIDVTSNTNVIPVVNELFTHQFGNPSHQTTISRWNVVTPNQTLNEIKSMLKEDSVSIRTLSLWNNNGTGGHSILVYSLEQDSTQKELYYLFVYDNSYPANNNALILIDTTGNSNQGTWLTTYGWTTWGGPKKLMLEIESVNYLNNATLPKNIGVSKSPFILEEDQLEISSGINSNAAITDVQGNIAGYINGQVFEEIPESVPLIYLNGSETPPYGYNLPTNNYSVVLNEFSEETIETFFFTGNKSFVYQRDGASVTQSDRLFFDGGVSVVNPDAQNKTISLLNLLNETTQEKLAVVSSLELAQNDSVKIENPDSNKIKLISYGSAKDYDIDLNYSTANGIGRFANSGVNLTANTSHTLLPDWTNLTNSQLIILVDIGNNGTIDDTLYIDNTVDVEDQGSLLSPNSYDLTQNYPNPFNPTTTIQYSIPQRSNVVLKIYDLLGSEVATLVNEEKERGVYTVNFDASRLASGLYLYRLQAGSFIETKKMILIK